MPSTSTTSGSRYPSARRSRYSPPDRSARRTQCSVPARSSGARVGHRSAAKASSAAHAARWSKCGAGGSTFAAFAGARAPDASAAAAWARWGRLRQRGRLGRRAGAAPGARRQAQRPRIAPATVWSPRCLLPASSSCAPSLLAGRTRRSPAPTGPHPSRPSFLRSAQCYETFAKIQLPAPHPPSRGRPLNGRAFYTKRQLSTLRSMRECWNARDRTAPAANRRPPCAARSAASKRQGPEMASTRSATGARGYARSRGMVRRPRLERPLAARLLTRHCGVRVRSRAPPNLLAL